MLVNLMATWYFMGFNYIFKYKVKTLLCNKKFHSKTEF
jgi:hypothetical protein